VCRRNTLKQTTGLVLLAVALSYFIPPTRVSAQTVRKSHEDCLKLVPGDWGTNFGEEWKQHEAVYWGCRLGVPVESISEWQRFSSGMIQDLIPLTIGNEQVVLIESMEGSAHCFSISALRKTPKGWESIWSPPSIPENMDYCTLSCPPIRMKPHGKNLRLELPEASDPKEDQSFSCKSVKWRKETYHWDGQTYQPTTVQPHSKTVQIAP
jgi:hypothetical protein